MSQNETSIFDIAGEHYPAERAQGITLGRPQGTIHFNEGNPGAIRRDPIDRVQKGVQGSPHQFDPPPTPWDAINRVPTVVLFSPLDWWLNRFFDMY